MNERQQVLCQGCVMFVYKSDTCQTGEGFNSQGYHPAAYTGEDCNGCGYCFYACPEPAAVTVFKKGAEVPDEEAA